MIDRQQTPFPLNGGRAGDGGDLRPKTLHAPGAVRRARRLRREMTLPEKVLWRALRKLYLNIRRQAPIGRYVADFVNHEAKLVIEVDSARHDLDESQIHDAERSEWLNSQGYRVIRFRNGEVVDHIDRVVATIEAALSPPTPAPSPIKGEGR